MQRVRNELKIAEEKGYEMSAKGAPKLREALEVLTAAMPEAEHLRVEETLVDFAKSLVTQKTGLLGEQVNALHDLNEAMELRTHWEYEPEERFQVLERAVLTV